jgi:hypothetical protein
VDQYSGTQRSHLQMPSNAHRVSIRAGKTLERQDDGEAIILERMDGEWL